MRAKSTFVCGIVRVNNIIRIECYVCHVIFDWYHTTKLFTMKFTPPRQLYALNISATPSGIFDSKLVVQPDINKTNWCSLLNSFSVHSVLASFNGIRMSLVLVFNINASCSIFGTYNGMPRLNDIASWPICIIPVQIIEVNHIFI